MSVQREVGWSSVVEANYTGSRGTHLFLPITTLTPLPTVLVDGAHGVERGRAESVLRAHHRSAGDRLNGPTVQRFRLLRPMPHFNGANVGTSEPPRGDSSTMRCR